MAEITLSILIGGWTILLGLIFYFQAKRDFQKHLEAERNSQEMNTDRTAD